MRSRRGSSQNGQLSEADLRILEAIYEGTTHFSQLKNALDVSNVYLAKRLKDLKDGSWVEKNEDLDSWSIPKTKLDNLKKQLDNRPEFLSMFSRDLLPIAKEIDDIRNPADRKNAYKQIIKEYVCMIARQSLYSMILAKTSRDKDKAIQSARSTYFYSIPNTLNILTKIVQGKQEIDGELLNEIANDILKIEDPALRGFLEVMRKNGKIQ